MTNRRHFLFATVALAGTGAAAVSRAQQRLTVDANAGPHRTMQSALDALPATGGIIEIRPGTYREKLRITKPDVHLIGLGAKPEDVMLVWHDGAKHVGGTGQSFSVSITGDGFSARNLTVQNDYSLRNPADRTQSVALMVTADRAVFDNVRFLSAQDTLYAASRGCGGEGCVRPSARQYYRDCYIEGEVDFIFGDAKAFFDHCRLHGIKYSNVMYTAQSKASPTQDSAYVFSNCTLTAHPEVSSVYLGRPWRAYSTVVFLNTDIQAKLNPAGWREWTPGTTDSLKTSYYAEFNSKGPGASPATRDPLTHQLTAAEAAKYSLASFFPGWTPRAV